MLSRRASETESAQVQERANVNAPPGEYSMASLPDPGEWNAPNDADESRHQQQQQEEVGGYYDQEDQYDDRHQYHDDDGQYQYEDDAEYQQEQEEEQYEYNDYDEDAPPAPYEEEDIPVEQPKQQRGVRFRSVLKREKSSSASDNNSKIKGRKQISAYNLFGLSRVSAAYDSGNKGYLTAAEQKLREMDKANVGALNNAQVAQLMEQKLREDEIIKRQRRLLYVLGCMTVLLMVSNLGTAWAAAILAKDTAVDMASGELRVHGGGGDGEGSGSAVVVTRAMGDSFLFHNFNASSTVLMNHHLESEEVEEEGDSMVPGGTGTTGTVGGGDNSAIADAEGDASTTSDLLVPGAEEEEEKEVDDDDSLFCISPKQAAKLWHETSTGTPVTAFFDYSPPTTDADASPPPEVHSLTLNADGALMNATHACLHTGLSSDAAGPQYVCIDFANTNCDVEVSRQQQEASAGTALSEANDGTASTDQRAATTNQNVFQGDNYGSHGGEDDGDHAHGRRVLFETALQELRDPSSEKGSRQLPSFRPNNLRGGSDAASSASTQTRRTRRKKKKGNNNQNPNRKNNRRKSTKKIFDMEIHADICIMIPMATGAAVHRPIPGGPQQVAPATPAENFGDFVAPYHGQS